MKENFKITRFKTIDEIEWLKKLPICMVNKYWLSFESESESDTLSEQLLYKDVNVVSNGITIGKVTKIIDNYFLCELIEPINYTELLAVGVYIENIVFDSINVQYGSDIDIN